MSKKNINDINAHAAINPIETAKQGTQLVGDLATGIVDVAKKGSLFKKKLEAKEERNKSYSDIQILQESELELSEFDIIEKVSNKVKSHYSKDEAYLELLKIAKNLNANTLIIVNINMYNPMEKKYADLNEKLYILDAIIANSTTKDERKQNEIKQLNQESYSIEKKALSELKELKELLDNDLINQDEFLSRESKIKEDLSNERESIKSNVSSIENAIENENILNDKIRRLFEGDDFIEFDNLKKYKFSSLIAFFRDKYLNKGFKQIKSFHTEDTGFFHIKYKDCEIILSRKKNAIRLEFINLRANLFTDEIEKMDKSILMNKVLQWESTPGDDTRLVYGNNDDIKPKDTSGSFSNVILFLILAICVFFIVVGSYIG